MSKHKSGELIIYHYSERGLIYYFMECLWKIKYESEQKIVLNKLIKILKIKVDKLKWLNLVIEPSFGKYGDPDLLILSNTGKKYLCIFIEAKRSSLESALKQKSTSNIICQLINKMKIARSKVENYGNKQWGIKYEDSNQKLKNKESIRILDLIVSENNKAHPDKMLEDYSEFYYVTLTNDNPNNIYRLSENIDELFNKLPRCATKNIDLYRENAKDRVRSITYYNIAECFPESNSIKKEYKRKLSYYNQKGRDLRIEIAG